MAKRYYKKKYKSKKRYYTNFNYKIIFIILFFPFVLIFFLIKIVYNLIILIGNINKSKANKKNEFNINDFGTFSKIDKTDIINVDYYDTEQNNFDYEKIKNDNSKKQKDINKSYEKKSLMTDYEKYFYDILQRNFESIYFIMPQVNLASVVSKIKSFPNQYQNELFRNIDFGIFDKNSMNLLLLIEINDSTHNQSKRKYRDNKVREICRLANIKLITFYTNYPNNENYVVNRVNNELSNN